MERPNFTKSLILKRLSKYQKLNYNRFMWWRMYGYKTKPLPTKSDFIDKIFNGDF